MSTVLKICFFVQQRKKYESDKLLRSSAYVFFLKYTALQLLAKINSLEAARALRVKVQTEPGGLDRLAVDVGV